MNDFTWVQAAPFRAHLRRLLELTGLPWPVLAYQADVPASMVEHLLFGRNGRLPTRIPVESARRLFALREATLLELRTCWVPADRTRADLVALLVQGCPPRSLARYCRLSEPQLLATLEASRCSRLTELLAAAARAQWRDTRAIPAGLPDRLRATA